MNLLFQQRPASVLPEHRPLYKIAQILLILFLASRGSRSSLARLHLLNWALKSPDRTARLSAAASSKSLNISAWGFDPALAIAMNFACAEELISTSGGSYELTDRGQILAKEIARDELILPDEKEALLKIGKGITEGMVEAIAKGWDSK
ncbi:hypothetical protein [Pseudomonas anguilliseptica]|uniref:hypothetical protein n=1 Tax=Pseudomonas anguilliseptica TaxID=53406 RepID=UPI0022AFAAA7|nr:hypothetical protein [Pseudomonas anguilliseptica]MCZ4323981.1 hypothetical protein [Pseudomonas anguilliseptica]